MKQVIIVRKDLKMGVGKIAAQVAHASLLAAEKSKKMNKELFIEWFNGGQAKIVLKVNTLEELLNIKEKAEGLKLPTEIVQDKGLTQLEEGTITCLGIGPADEELIDKVTGNLKLL
ncbi:MAG: peptidyl-tRNA hydrolase Pth2 [Candidatus Nitrosocaldaceae archaeon]